MDFDDYTVDGAKGSGEKEKIQYESSMIGLAIAVAGLLTALFFTGGFVHAIPLTLVIVGLGIYMILRGEEHGFTNVGLAFVALLGVAYAVFGWMVFSQNYGDVNPYYGAGISAIGVVTCIVAFIRGRA